MKLLHTKDFQSFNITSFLYPITHLFSYPCIHACDYRNSLILKSLVSLSTHSFYFHSCFSHSVLPVSYCSIFPLSHHTFFSQISLLFFFIHSTQISTKIFTYFLFASLNHSFLISFPLRIWPFPIAVYLFWDTLLTGPHILVCLPTLSTYLSDIRTPNILFLFFTFINWPKAHSIFCKYPKDMFLSFILYSLSYVQQSHSSHSSLSLLFRSFITTCKSSVFTYFSFLNIQLHISLFSLQLNKIVWSRRHGSNHLINCYTCIQSYTHSKVSSLSIFFSSCAPLVFHVHLSIILCWKQMFAKNDPTLAHTFY